MAFKKRNRSESTIPEVNLVPMMDVLMTVLTFFIIISMSLTSQSILTVEAPEAEGDDGGASPEDALEPFVVGLNANGDILISDDPVDSTTLRDEMRTYFAANPEGYIRIKADRQLNYEEVTRFLITLRDMGGGRVALAYE